MSAQKPLVRSAVEPVISAIMRSVKETDSRTCIAAQLITAAFLGLLFFLLTMPHAALTGGATGFSAFEDEVQTLTSLRYFVWDQWRWPLFLASGLGVEPGTIIVLTDSNPLYGLFLRLIRPLITPDFNFIALWLGFCYVMQALGGALAMRLAGVTKWTIVIPASALVLTMPAWIIRIAQSAQNLHFFILFGVGLYFFTARTHKARPVMYLGIALAVTSVLVNAYHFLMATSFVAAAVILLWTERSIRLRRCLLYFTILTLTSVATMVASGFFAPKGPGQGFGVYSMNMLSPFLPRHSGIFGSLFPNIDATGGQHEGYNYLGLGFILVIALAFVFLLRRQRISWVSRHWAVLTSGLVFTMLALSNKVYLGHRLILDLGNPPDFVAMFRCSGRFFWAPAYFLLLSSVVIIARSAPRWLTSTFLIVAAGIQFWDTVPNRQSVARVLKGPSIVTMPQDLWSEFLSHHDHVEIQPVYECVDSIPQQHAASEIMFHTSGSQTPVNTVYLARPMPKPCDELLQNAVHHRQIEPGRLLVLLRGKSNIDAYAYLPDGIVNAHEFCRPFPYGQLCSSSVDWQQFDSRFAHLGGTRTDAPIPQFRLDHRVSFNNAGLGAASLVSGWHPPDEIGAWTNGKRGVLAFTLDQDDAHQPLELTLFGEFLRFCAKDRWTRTLRVSVNGTQLWSHTYPTEAYEVELKLPMACKITDGTQVITVTLEVDRPPTADEALGNHDPRYFGLRLHTMELRSMEGNAEEPHS